MGLFFLRGIAAYEPTDVVFKNEADALDALIHVPFHVVPQKFQQKAQEGIGVVLRNVPQFLLGDGNPRRLPAEELVEGVVGGIKNTALQPLPGQGVEQMVDNASVGLHIPHHKLCRILPAAGLGRLAQVRLLFDKQPGVQQVINVPEMVVKDIGTDLTAGNQCTDRYFVEGHPFQHLLKGL